MSNLGKYIWLVNTIRNHNRGVPFRWIASEWEDSELNTKGTQLNNRTFFRWKEEVNKLFGITIECDTDHDYCYYIADDSKLEESRITSWMLHTMTISNIIEEYKGDMGHILLEHVPSGDQYLMPLLQAMKKQNQVRIIYHRFQEEEAREAAIINPLCVKLFERRWYAVVDYVENKKRRVISLDCIVEMELLKQQFSYPKDFNANEYFAFDYGIDDGSDEKPRTIRLKVNREQRPYTRALPLHYSQKEVETHDDYSVFEYFLKPSKSFARAILPFGMNYEVLKPQDFRELVRNMALKIVETNK